MLVNPDSKVHGAYMGPTWGRQDPGGPHVGPMNLAIRECNGLALNKQQANLQMHYILIVHGPQAYRFTSFVSSQLPIRMYILKYKAMIGTLVGVFMVHKWIWYVAYALIATQLMVTKTPFVNFSVSNITFIFCRSACNLWWFQSHMNSIFNR